MIKTLKVIILGALFLGLSTGFGYAKRIEPWDVDKQGRDIEDVGTFDAVNAAITNLTATTVALTNVTVSSLTATTIHTTNLSATTAHITDAIITNLTASTVSVTGSSAIAFTGAATISTASGNLVIDPFGNLNILSDTDVTGDVNVSSDATVTGTVDAGALDNTPIGAVTPSTGAFTTLSATGQITSTIAQGTAPFVLASTTKTAKLNVDYLDDHDSTYFATGASMASVESDVSTLQTSMASVEGDISTLETSMATVEASIVTIEIDITNLQTTMATVEASIATIETDITNLQTTMASVQTDITNLQTTMATVEASIATIEAWDADDIDESATRKWAGATGADMLTSTYDTDSDSRVDVAEAISDGTTEITAGQVMSKATYDTDADGIVDKAEDLEITSQATGDVLYFNGSIWVRLGKDTGKYLKSGDAPSWDTPAGAAAMPDQMVTYTALSFLVPMASDPVTAIALNSYVNCAANIQIPCIEFDDSTEWARNWIVPVHENFDTTSNISFEVHGMPKTAAANKNVKFKIYWLAMGSGDLYSGNYASVETADLAVSSTQASKDTLTFVVNNTTLGWAPGDIVYIQITRIDADANDLAGHYQVTVVIAYLKKE